MGLKLGKRQWAADWRIFVEPLPVGASCGVQIEGQVVMDNGYAILRDRHVAFGAIR